MQAFVIYLERWKQNNNGDKQLHFDALFAKRNLFCASDLFCLCLSQEKSELTSPFEVLIILCASRDNIRLRNAPLGYCEAVDNHNYKPSAEKMGVIQSRRCSLHSDTGKGSWSNSYLYDRLTFS